MEELAIESKKAAEARKRETIRVCFKFIIIMFYLNQLLKVKKMLKLKRERLKSYKQKLLTKVSIQRKILF